MEIINLSNIFNPLDENVLTYNGSLFPLGKSYYLCAYRSTQKPQVEGVSPENIPPYPYQQLNSDLWFNKDNYVGLAIVDLSRDKVLYTCKYIHRMTQKEKETLKKNDAPHVNSGGEDPRLYKKNNKFFMNYNQDVIKPKAGCDYGICIGMFEVEIVLNTIVKNNGGFYSDTDKKLVCEHVYDDNELRGLFATTPQKIIKNWSYSPGYFIDSYNDDAFIYKLVDNLDPTVCDKISYPYVLKPFVQSDWSVALTTPSVLHGDALYGMAHIRIKWSLLVENINSVSKDLRAILLKDDEHHPDCYFMSVYKVRTGNWSMTSPFLITGSSTKEYYSYNVNFPCGFFIHDNMVNTTFGLGDCLLIHFKQKLNKITFRKSQFTYKDLTVFPFTDPIFQKTHVNSRLCNIPQLKRYLLPKHIRLFDLGGGGLRSVKYSSISDKFKKVVEFGIEKEEILPGEIVRKIQNKYIDVEKENLNGYGFGFSLAGLDKLWDESISKKMVKKLESKKYKNTAEEFNLVDTDKIVSLTDSESHLYGSFAMLEKLDIDVSQYNILNIAIGTGINISFSEKGVSKAYHESVDPSTYFWDIKVGKNRSIRGTLLDVEDLIELSTILNVFLRLLPNDINMTSLWPESWENPDLIFITGGGANVLIDKFKDEMAESLPNTYSFIGGLEEGPNIEIFLCNDKMIPYRGLVWSLMHKICTHDQ